MVSNQYAGPTESDLDIVEPADPTSDDANDNTLLGVIMKT